MQYISYTLDGNTMTVLAKKQDNTEQTFTTVVSEGLSPDDLEATAKALVANLEQNGIQ